MPTFSLEFWIGTALAILLSILATAVGVGMDARTRGEYLFVVICFCLSWLAIAFTVGLWHVHTTTPPVRRTIISGVFLAVVSVGLFTAIRWAADRHEGANLRPVEPPFDKELTPFSVTVETSIFSNTFEQGGSFWAVERFGPKRTKSPINAILAVRIVNNQSIASMISQFSTQAETSDGRWVPIIRINSRLVQLFFVADNDFTKAGLNTPTMLDSMLENRSMSPHETLKGFLLYAYPRGKDYFTGKFRFSVADTAGVKYTQQQADLNAGNFGGNELPAGGYQDISSYPVSFLQDWPANHVTQPW